MFELSTMHEARVCSVTNRVERHGDDDKPAVTLRVEITAANTLLDTIDPKIREALYKAAEGQEQLPGMEPTTPVLRCNSFETHTLPTSYEGWTLEVDDGIDDTKPMTFGGVKVDKFTLDAKQGGSVVLGFRLGTADVDADKLGKLAMHNGQSIWITLKAPEKKPEPIDGTKGHPGAASANGEPDATDLFAGGSEGHADDRPACESCGGDMEKTENAEGDVYLKCESCGWTPPAAESEGGETDAGSSETEGASSETEAASAATNTAPRATLSPEAAWPFPKNQGADAAPPRHLTEPKVSKASRKRAKAGAEA